MVDRNLSVLDVAVRLQDKVITDTIILSPDDITKAIVVSGAMETTYIQSGTGLISDGVYPVEPSEADSIDYRRRKEHYTKTINVLIWEDLLTTADFKWGLLNYVYVKLIFRNSCI
ncbi:hypothetical protein GWI33_005785 [Rhynchophorus ferrugineus]|uniref:Uncharacterized protein n=1 Tax=Rhynchophorus ferrugineus TaxID=354439 RepID=A0A834IS77_RHYFE|nr:hypothetical protein GWI33_005785 [Rhynchophorus ferrugineus]